MKQKYAVIQTVPHLLLLMRIGFKTEAEAKKHASTSASVFTAPQGQPMMLKLCAFVAQLV